MNTKQCSLTSDTVLDGY